MSPQTKVTSTKSVATKKMVKLSGRIWVEPLEARLVMATLNAGFIESLISTLAQPPTSMAFSPDGSRLYVTQEDGNLRVIQNGTLLTTPFMTVSTDTFSERGLLGVALDPNFTTNRQLYTYHTTPSAVTPRRHLVTRWTADASLNVASGTGTTIFQIPATNAGNHNGGALNFGPDGKLYIAVGDGASSPTDAQSLGSLNGKILRINTDGTIPSDNPFFTNPAVGTGNNRAIYALGLRNPFTFAFQPGTNLAFVNDVGSSGANRREETNPLSAGANFGWPNVEGIQASPPAFANGTYTNPVYVYNDGFSMTGSVFYNPQNPMFPANLVGRYFLADYVNGFIRSIPTTAPFDAVGFATGASGPVDLDVNPADGSLYYLEYSSRRVMRVFVSTSLLPTISNQPTNQNVAVGQNATFSVIAGGPAAVSYRWQQALQWGSFSDIGGATNPSYTRTNNQLADNNLRLRVVVTNIIGSATSNEAILGVINNTAPVPSITSPLTSLRFAGGVAVNYQGTATDTQDGTLPASAFSWTIEYITGSAPPRPFLGPIVGVTSGSFTPASVTPYLLTDVAYRITLTVTDSLGAQTSTAHDVLPSTSVVGLRTSPAGIGLTLDGVPTTTPVDVDTVVGLERTLEAPASVVISGQTFQFDNWSNGGARSQVLTTPGVNTNYTATFRDVTAPTAVAQVFETDSPQQRLRVVFSENVQASLANTDVLLTNLTTGQVVSSGLISLSYDANTNTATFDFASPLPDGNYTLLLPSASASDGTGNTLALNVSASFYTLGGDFNRNRTTDFNDLVILARNFNQSPRVNSLGDANYDGITDFNDLVILARNFNVSLASPPSPVFAGGRGSGSVRITADTLSPGGKVAASEDGAGKQSRKLLA